MIGVPPNFVSFQCKFCLFCLTLGMDVVCLLEGETLP